MLGGDRAMWNCVQFPSGAQGLGTQRPDQPHGCRLLIRLNPVSQNLIFNLKDAIQFL